jgi:16S rRNA (guanine966-N2)-methyltransferase
MRRRAAEPASGTVRIIGGEWRGRRLPVPSVGVRPSPDRVRETLFNWLAPRLRDARCLDLFAGTGVLGFEALSRGARAALLIDSDAAVVTRLEESRRLLAAGRADILRYDAAAWLATAPVSPCDIVFVDPPFAAGLATAVLALLARGWVAEGGVVYVEAPAAPALPPGWTVLREGRTRQVVYALVAPAPAEPDNANVERDS